MSTSLNLSPIARLGGHNAAIFALTPDADQRYFLSAAGDGWIVRWDLDDPDPGRLIAKVDTQVFSLCCLPDQQRVVAGNMNGGVHWIDLQEPKNTRNIAHHEKGVFAIEKVEDDLFTAGGQGMLTRWSVAQSRTEESIKLSNQSLRSLAVHPGNNQLAVGSSDNSIYLLKLPDLQLIHTIRNAHDNSVFSLQYSPDGRYLLSGSRDAHLKVWDIWDGFQEIVAKPAHWFTINAIAFHPAGKWLATASRDKTIKIWDAGNFELLKVIETVRDNGHVNSVNSLLWTPYRNYLLSASDDRTIGIWQVEAQND
ncbi:WD40 repeat domain-containing protein [Flavilitoribacter nigricans]|uniref:Uncharacterized protein n=1 Tax=Flavilitoribacter nigricans (strain ATCC 23147 / DSM 23189 / NBRC 102662 / NCIMB 1420 / SS-2) TaxID=1122177 RepID=A0A2D0MXE0_FLAN2|nr:WD40 repeat domain-containing protein [Flavilitoribacter nigricans]PHN00867.1 hypothetical protein CRP01_39965 [Flavilitoribacter nigricans DSM 23189 = NBRC 102662]